MPNVYMLELLIIAGNHSETSIAVELYATPCDVACDDATALAGFLGGRTDERSRQDDSEEKDAPMTEAHAMGKTSFLVQSLLLGPHHGRQAMGCSWRAMREEGRLT